jgi:hypothetical protein
MDDVAIAFSHLDYHSCVLNLNNAELVVDKIIQSMSSLFRSREIYFELKNTTSTIDIDEVRIEDSLWLIHNYWRYILVGCVSVVFGLFTCTGTVTKTRRRYD